MSTLSETVIEQAELSILHTYNRFPVVFERGEGVYLYDIEGEKYLDFFSGIGVFALGHHYPSLDQAMKDQIDKLLHISNYFYNQPAVEAATKLTKLTGLSKVFFTNSGTEAIEGAIKVARRYGYNKDNKHDHEIIAMHHSFHGRSMGALSITGTETYREPFLPLIGGVHFAELNDIDSVKMLINEKTCAIILEPIQGEGGIHAISQSYARELRQICDYHDFLLIFDEVQCGLGRTGALFYYEQLGIRPDVLTVAKALGNGLPIGAFLCAEKATTLVVGDHGSTYGGNPFVCAAASKILDVLENESILQNVKSVGEYLSDKLEEIQKDYSCVKERRGVGLMQGLELKVSAKPIINESLKHGLVLISAGQNVIRFLPPLIINKCHVDEMICILRKTLNSLNNNG